MYGPPANYEENPGTGGLIAALLGVVVLTGAAVWYMRSAVKKAEAPKPCGPLGDPVTVDQYDLLVAVKDADGNHVCAGPGAIVVWEAGTELTDADAPDAVTLKIGDTEYAVFYQLTEVDDTQYQATVSMGYGDVKGWLEHTKKTFTGTWGEWTFLDFPHDVKLAVQANPPE